MGENQMSIDSLPLLLNAEQVCDLIGFRQTWLDIHSSNGTFPRKIKLGRASRWNKAEVLAWIQQKSEEGTTPTTCLNYS